MSLKDLLLEKKSSIVDAWCELTRRTYPEESQSFFSKKDQFGNPVGHAIATGLPLLFEAVVEDQDPGNVGEALDNIIRIRAVQEFSPSEAVSFVLGLKGVIKEALGDGASQSNHLQEWGDLEAKIDSLALLAFDLYSRCKQSIYDIRVAAVKRHTERLLQMAGLVYEIPEFDPDRKQGEEPKRH